MNAPCPLRPGNLPHYYGPRSECLYCGHVIEHEDPPLNCDSTLTPKERRVAGRLSLIVVVMLIVTVAVMLGGCVTWVHHFEPGAHDVLCGNSLGCTDVAP